MNSMVVSSPPRNTWVVSSNTVNIGWKFNENDFSKQFTYTCKIVCVTGLNSLIEPSIFKISMDRTTLIFRLPWTERVGVTL
jgi:hypothetical protein